MTHIQHNGAMDCGNPNNPLRKTSAKATKVVVEMRVTEVIKMLANCWRHDEIVSYGKTEWGINKAQMESYMRKARKAVHERYIKTDRHEYISIKLDQLEALCRMASQANQMSAAVGAMGLQLKVIGALDNLRGSNP